MQPAPRIVWGAVSGAGGYQVVTSASSGGTYTYLKSLTGTSLIVSGLTPGQTYWYKVRSYKLVSGVKQWSGYSAPASVSIMATPVLSSAVASGSSAVLGWSAAANAAGYRVYRSTSLSGTYAYVKTVTGLSYSDTGLSSGTYYYKLKAFRVYGSTQVQSAYSNARSVTIAATGYAPPTEHSLLVTRTTRNMVTTSL